MTPTVAARQVAQQAEGLAVVLADLVVDVADAGVGHRQLGQLAVALRLDDGPAGRGHQLVDARLVVAVGVRCAARARPTSSPTMACTSSSGTSDRLIVHVVSLP